MTLPKHVILILTLISCIQSKGSIELYFDTRIADDATPTVLRKIMAGRDSGISKITFEKGIYHFYPDKALEYYMHISNHNDVNIRTAFPIEKIENITIDGQDSKFIFHGRMVPFLIDHCKNVTLKNITIDWEQSFHSEAIVVANDLQKKTFDIKIPQEYPYEIRNGQLIFIKEYYEHTIGQTILYDPVRKAISFNTESYTPLTIYDRNITQRNVNNIKYKYERDLRGPEMKVIGSQNRLIVEELEPSLVRIVGHKKKMPEVGKILVCKGEQKDNRLAPAIRVTFTDQLHISNMTVHHAGGMGLIAENSSNLYLDKFNVVPSQGRMVSTTADATHFVGCRGKVELTNCTFHQQLDDATNVHGTYQKVIDVLNKNQLGVRMGHYQQQAFVIGKQGDAIGLVRLEESFFPYEKLTLQRVQKINSRYQILTFKEEIPKSIQSGDLIENLDAYPEVLIENCDISRNRARGVLLSSPKKTIIRNNFFGSEMEAILIPVESNHWYESGSAVDLTIDGNTFQDCLHSGQNRGVIRLVTDDHNKNIAFKNIKIINNTFNHFDNYILEINNTDSLLVQGNTFTDSQTFPSLYPENPVLRIRNSKNITLRNNKYIGSAQNILDTDEPNKALKFQ
ncbi:alpha-1,3-galactosidase-related protein [Reichenbachiella versicolor]|uniref:alpha-1,3-galactosidase-related protein n=1 Tax=Reichenbachiella versicolor TaxID=1821036 RepID=UPI000D6DE7FA|nr:right-handed parallel beta-helix repeat-containing protein [Reichenbachiella versicolor]